MTPDRLKLLAAVNTLESVHRKALAVMKDAEAAVDFCKLTEQVYHRKLIEAKRALGRVT